MKTSNKILFITGLTIVAILLASVIGSRIFLNKFSNTYKSGDPNYSNIENEYKDITGDCDITEYVKIDVTVL